MMAKVYIILGGNLGDRMKNLELARNLIGDKIGPVVSCSSIYETEPWGFVSEKLFINQAVEIDTVLTPLEILQCIKMIEEELGRTRGVERYMERTIDIDILFYDYIVTETQELTIPHPEMAKRRFVLEPLAEIAPEMIHPVLKKLVKELLVECTDSCKVARIN